MKNRVYFSNTLIHCYQRTSDRGVLFYTFSDFLVYFTLYCIVARKYSICVLALCQMPDHIHDSIITCSDANLCRFKDEVNTGFARKWNAHAGLSGHVFESPYGSAVKMGDKKVRTNIIYVGNNPVERKLVMKAEDYRWNYLAYAVSDHPFSEKLVIREASWPLQKAAREVKSLFKAGKPLNYAILKRLFGPLNRNEILKLTDFIIKTYNVIDYEEASRYFGSYEDMLASMHATTGSEYDINEVFIGKDDSFYARMTSVLMKEAGMKDIHDILAMDTDSKLKLFVLLQQRTKAPVGQIAAFLHLPIRRE